jgi:hypothetical protein
MDAVAGQITAPLYLQGDFSQGFAGKFLFVVSSPAGHFAALTNTFTLTNAALGQQFTGTVYNNGTNLPGVPVMLFQASQDGMNPAGGTVTDNTGAYTASAPPGTYTLVAFGGSNLIANLKAWRWGRARRWWRA